MARAAEGERSTFVSSSVSLVSPDRAKQDDAWFFNEVGQKGEAGGQVQDCMGLPPGEGRGMSDRVCSRLPHSPASVLLVGEQAATVN